MSQQPPSDRSLPNMQLDLTAEIARELIRFDTSNFGQAGRRASPMPPSTWQRNWVSSASSPSCSSPTPGARASSRGSGAATGPCRRSSFTATSTLCPRSRDWSGRSVRGRDQRRLLWGRGAVDMKNMDAMSSRCRDLLRAGAPGRAPRRWRFFADEEAGGVWGLTFSSGPTRSSRRLRRGDQRGRRLLDQLDDKRAYLLQTGEKALIWVKLIARGRGATVRMIANNAVTRLARRSRPSASGVARRLTETTRAAARGVSGILDCRS